MLGAGRGVDVAGGGGAALGVGLLRGGGGLAAGVLGGHGWGWGLWVVGLWGFWGLLEYWCWGESGVSWGGRWVGGEWMGGVR